MTNRQVETSREIRLWITGIISPIVAGGLMIIAGDPELRAQVTTWTKSKVKQIKKKFQKKEEKQNA